MKPAPECRNMSDVRGAIDALDEQLVALLARRVRYIERAAELKPGLGIPADAPERVREVLGRVEALARGARLPIDLADQLWRRMIAWAIDHETRLMAEAAARGPDGPTK
jgi:isochorismate pyruvate lyase